MSCVVVDGGICVFLCLFFKDMIYLPRKEINKKVNIFLLFEDRFLPIIMIYHSIEIIKVWDVMNQTKELQNTKFIDKNEPFALLNINLSVICFKHHLITAFFKMFAKKL